MTPTRADLIAASIPWPPPPPPLGGYKDEVSVCPHQGPYAPPVISCQGCGTNVICTYCRYQSHHREVCIRCYYRVTAWAAVIEKRLGP